MPRISDFRKKKILDLEIEAYLLYRQGVSLRDIEQRLRGFQGLERTYEWFRQAIKRRELLEKAGKPVK